MEGVGCEGFVGIQGVFAWIGAHFAVADAGGSVCGNLIRYESVTPVHLLVSVCHGVGSTGFPRGENTHFRHRRGCLMLPLWLGR